MIRYRVVSAWVGLVLVAAACGGGGGGGGAAENTAGVQGATSVLCPGITGGEALMWDILNGVFRTDPVLPPAPPAGPTYTHPVAPTLGFFHAPEYTPFTSGVGIQEFGVDLVRNDNQVVWREYYKNVFAPITAIPIRDGETQGVLSHLGQGGAQIQVVCNREATFPDPSTGFTFSVANIMFRVGAHTSIVLVNTTFNPGSGTTSTVRKVYLAPTAEFGARAIDTFLAIDYQMNLGDISGFQDRDGDCWRDPADIDPDDPNEPTPGGICP